VRRGERDPSDFVSPAGSFVARNVPPARARCIGVGQKPAGCLKLASARHGHDDDDGDGAHGVGRWRLGSSAGRGEWKERRFAPEFLEPNESRSTIALG